MKGGGAAGRGGAGLRGAQAESRRLSSGGASCDHAATLLQLASWQAWDGSFDHRGHSGDPSASPASPGSSRHANQTSIYSMLRGKYRGQHRVMAWELADTRRDLHHWPIYLSPAIVYYLSSFI